MGQAGVPTPRPDSSGSVCEPSQRLSNHPLGMGLAVRRPLSKADGFGSHQRCRSRSSTRRASARRWRSWWYRAATVAIPTSTTYSSTAAVAVKRTTTQRTREGVDTARSSKARRAARFKFVYRTQLCPFPFPHTCRLLSCRPRTVAKVCRRVGGTEAVTSQAGQADQTGTLVEPSLQYRTESGVGSVRVELPPSWVTRRVG